MLLPAILFAVISILLTRLASRLNHSKRRRKKEWVLPLNIVAFLSGLGSIYCFYLVLDSVR